MWKAPGVFLCVSGLIVIATLVCSCSEDTGLERSVVKKTSGLVPTYLRCEYLTEPLGIDVTSPRLSWIVESSQRGQKQTAYQVIVASSEESLKSDNGDLWDSGKVTSDETVAVAYDGKPLESRVQCYWKVRAWDKNGKASSWSKAARWGMGLLAESDWKAKWIGFDARQAVPQKEDIEPESLLKHCWWLWYPGGQPDKGVPVGTCYIRSTIKADADRKIKQARLIIRVDDEAVAYINSEEVAKFKGTEVDGICDVSDKLRVGENILAIAATNTGDKDNPAGIIGKLLIEYETGRPADIWINWGAKTSKNAGEGWTEADYDDSDWSPLKVFARVGDEPWEHLRPQRLELIPPAYLRKDFSIKGPVKRAMLYASALGDYRMHINGQQVGKNYYTPGWTDYKARVYYNTYDVTEFLAEGDNAVAAILADGWYAGYVGGWSIKNRYGSRPRVIGQMHIEYSDGSAEIIATDESWKAGAGPLVEADYQMGEAYDARKEIPGWDKVGFDETNWEKVDTGREMEPELQGYPCQPVKRIAEFKTIKITEPRKGCYIFDLGQNLAGLIRLKVRGQKAGQKIVMRFGERLYQDGTLYTSNLRGVRATDTYICRGDDVEMWQQQFTNHGFRYVEARGLRGKPAKDMIVAIALSCDTPVVGTFECSDKMVNQLFSNIYWSHAINFTTIPTDCPQRDERLAWTGDAHMIIRTASLNTDVQNFFAKWLVDLEDAQRPDGDFPCFAPYHKAGYGASGGAAWSDAGVILPWTLYQVYGDKRVLEKQYESMVRFMDYYIELTGDDCLPPKKFKCYGDHLNVKADTPKDVIYCAYFAYTNKLMGQIAEVLGKKDDAEKYNKVFEKTKAAFGKAFVAEDGKVKGDTQCGYVLALRFDLLDVEKRELAAEHLIEAIKRRDWHLSTGFVGTKDLMPVLSEIGRGDVAYRLLGNDTFPSWGFEIKNGATTVWEHWGSLKPDKSFQSPLMNSFAHHPLGAVGQWMYENIGGIRTDGPAYKRIIIRPEPGGKLKFAKVSYKSSNGTIISDWKIEGKKFKLDVTIPANTTATVYVPTKEAGSITENGRAASQAQGVEFIKYEDGAAVFAVESGTYQFVSKL